ncbi:MAG TPA: hypothetical protein VFK89_01665, partial [Actinomycetota bacterium]|nr:hypothetical protein [Actinomycetota bacterium]
WLQANVNSSHQWCTQKVISEVDLPSDITVGDLAPADFDITRTRTFRTKLSTNADGNGTERAQITQDQIVYPNHIGTRLVNDSNIFRLKWRGDEDDKLAFASGAEISWDAADSPGGSTFHLNYSLRKTGCGG